MTDKAIIIITPVEASPGGTADHPSFLRSAIAAGKGLRAGVPSGMLPELLGTTVYQALFPDGVIVPPPAAPGDAPVVTNDALGDRTLNAHGRSVKTHAEYHSDLNRLTSAVHLAMDTRSRAELEDPVKGLFDVTLPVIMARVKRNTGSITHSMKAQNLALMRRVYDPTLQTMSQYTTALTTLFILAAHPDYNSAQSESDKVTNLVNAVRPCGKFNTTIDHYMETDHVNPVYNILVDRLIAADNNKRLSTVGEVGFGNASIDTAKMVEDLRREISDFRAMYANAAAANNGRVPPTLGESKRCEDCSKTFSPAFKLHVRCDACHRIFGLARKDKDKDKGKKK